MKYAAIDIGTNAARLLVGEVMSKDQSFLLRRYHILESPCALVKMFLSRVRFQKQDR